VTAAARPTPPATPPGAIPTIAWRSEATDGLPGRLEILDQTRLPREAVVLELRGTEEVREAIRRLAVRGAPAIGVAAAYGLVSGVQDSVARGPEEFAAALSFCARRLRESRPTAVNLAWAVDRCVRAVADERSPPRALRRLLAEARAIHREDEEACAAMGRHGASLLGDGAQVLTHCNSGRLATAGIGTALGVAVTAHAWGLRPTVWVGEVRPLLQGARLTAFELRERGMDGRLLPDGAAGALLASGRIDAVFVGADRIARNGDAANKIGTYPLAALARANGVPFHVVAPTSTVDPTIADGSSVPIEERDAEEVLSFAGVATAPPGFPAWNPAFDVTPAHLISSIVTERGIVLAPYGRGLSF
jgi:methylthioribose-1-phosphate isomerase